MANQLDFAPIFSPTGTLYQIQYAQKCATAGNTALALKSTDGLVLMAMKPIVSKHHVDEKNHRVHKLSPSIYAIYAGLETDGISIGKHIRESSFYNIELYGEDLCNKELKTRISEYFTVYSRIWSTRPLGINMLTGQYNNGEYSILYTDTSGYTRNFEGYAMGKGHNRAKTELEFVDFKSMALKEMVRQGIKILYKSFDPLKDEEFNIEIVVCGKDTDNKFHRMEKSEYSEYIEEFEGLTIDD